MWLELPELPASICAQRPWVRLMKILCGDSFSFLTHSPHPSFPKKWDINQPLGVEQSLHLASWCSRRAPHHAISWKLLHCLYWTAEGKQRCDTMNGIHYPHLFVQPSLIQWASWELWLCDHPNQVSTNILSYYYSRCPDSKKYSISDGQGVSSQSHSISFLIQL